MPTRKIADDPTPKPCTYHDHDPPNMRVFEPGVYEHECPACGRKITFTVHDARLKTAAAKRSCSSCGGTGEGLPNFMEGVRDPCTTCHGTGRSVSTQVEDDGTNPMHAFGHGRGD